MVQHSIKKTPEILILFYSKYGNTRALAHAIAEGVQAAGGTPKLRSVPEVATVTTANEPSIPPSGELYAEVSDLETCDALALGSPTRFGNMAAPLKHFLEQTTTQWLSGALQGKPACVFTTTGSQHGGQETTLLSMMLPLMHHGMLLLGLPYSEPALSNTKKGGTPYGATRVTGQAHDAPFSEHERTLAVAQGKRLAQVAAKLMLDK